MVNVGRGWIFLSKAPNDYRRPTGGVHYDDDPSIHYSWDSTVPNHANVKSGHVIALRDQNVLLGVSVIESVDLGEGTKVRHRCPNCGSTRIDTRSRGKYSYRCDARVCREYFDAPSAEVVNVVTYRCNHAQAWVDLDGLFTAGELQKYSIRPGSQNSLRPLDVEGFRRAVRDAANFDPFRVVDGAIGQILGGHSYVIQRVRLGQGNFRMRLRSDYGDVCAFTGPAPADALDACHLYSYAKVGEHKDRGGLLLRKDLHYMFDRGLITVDEDGALDIDSSLYRYPEYASMHGENIQIELTSSQRLWLAAHWNQWRL